MRKTILALSTLSLAACTTAGPAPGETNQAIVCSIPQDEIYDYCATSSAAPCNGLTDTGSCLSLGTLPYPSHGHLVDPQIIRIYLDFPPGKPAEDAVWTSLAGSKTFWDRLSFYGVGTGSDGGWKVVSGYFPPTGGENEFVGDCQLEGTLDLIMAQGQVPVPANLGDGTHGTTAAIYVLYLPPNYCPSWFGGAKCPIDSGYHSSYITGTGQLVTYAVISPTTTVAAAERVSSHEIAEAATDFDILDCPVLWGAAGCGWNGPIQGAEVADACHAKEIIAGYTVAQVLDSTCGSCI
jgi:hypothetical protein